RPLELATLRLRIEPVQLDRLALGLDESIHTDDHALAGLDLLLVAESGLLDLVLHEAAVDRLDRTAELVNALDELRGALLELARERLDEVRAAERIGGVGAAGLVREKLLGPQRDLGRPLRG